MKLNGSGLSVSSLSMWSTADSINSSQYGGWTSNDPDTAFSCKNGLKTKREECYYSIIYMPEKSEEGFSSFATIHYLPKGPEKKGEDWLKSYLIYSMDFQIVLPFKSL